MVHSFGKYLVFRSSFDFTSFFSFFSVFLHGRRPRKLVRVSSCGRCRRPRQLVRTRSAAVAADLVRVSSCGRCRRPRKLVRTSSCGRCRRPRTHELTRSAATAARAYSYELTRSAATAADLVSSCVRGRRLVRTRSAVRRPEWARGAKDQIFRTSELSLQVF
jgi:hypothetical protein